MNQSNLITEKHDLLITPHLTAGQLPTLLEQAVAVAPVGEMRDMLLLSLLTNWATPCLPCVCSTVALITPTAPSC